MIVPLFAQILCSNACKTAIVTSWAIAVICFNVGHHVVGASWDSYIWLNFTFLFFMHSSYEIESSFVERFLLTKVRSSPCKTVPRSMSFTHFNHLFSQRRSTAARRSTWS